MSVLNWDGSYLMQSLEGEYENELAYGEPRSIDRSMERRCGLKLIVNHEPLDGFGDTGSSHNIVNQNWATTRKLGMIKNAMDLTMGNGRKLHSPGYVELDVGFAKENVTARKIIARVVENLPFDLLLSRPFLKATQTLNYFKRRFVKCIFPRLKNLLSMNLLSDEPNGERFHGLFNDDIQFTAVLDTGSNCNIMELDWAHSHNLKVLTSDEYRGWISLPSNERVPTIGRVHVDMTLPDGRITPLHFQVLEKTAVSIVLGDDAVLDHDLYSAYPDSLYDKDNGDDVDQLLFMDYEPWYKNVLKIAKLHFANTPSSQSQSAVANPNESERRWSWNKKYKYGKSASADEWWAELGRRKLHERARTGQDDLEFDVRLIRDVSTDLLVRIGEQPFVPSPAGSGTTA
jgi:hypothetical protein